MKALNSTVAPGSMPAAFSGIMSVMRRSAATRFFRYTMKVEVDSRCKDTQLAIPLSNNAIGNKKNKRCERTIWKVTRLEEPQSEERRSVLFDILKI